MTTPSAFFDSVRATLEASSTSSLLCAATYAITAVIAWRSHLAKGARFAVAVGCASTSAWAIATLIGGERPWREEIEITRAAAWLLFFSVFFGPVRSLQAKLERTVPVMLFGLLAIAVWPAISGGMLLLAAGQPPDLLPPLRLAINAASLLLLGQLVLTRPRHTHPRQSLLFVAIGLLCAQDFFFTLFAFVSGGAAAPFGMPLHFMLLVCGVMLSAALIGRGGWCGELTLSRRAVLYSTTLIAAAFYLTTTSVAGEVLRLKGGDWGTTVELTFFTAAVAVLMVLMRSASVRARAMVLISKHFFRLKYDYREVWLNFIRRMASPEAKESLHERTLRAVAEAIQCRGGALWGLQPTIDGYAPLAVWNLPGQLPMIAATESLPSFLRTSGWIVDIRECRHTPEIYAGLALPAWLTKLDPVWVVVPLIHNRVLEAILVLRRPVAAPAKLSWEEFDLLKTVGAQAASYLAEERASRELDDSRQLGEFNRRFAFVVHDIKNVVNQMGLMLQNAERFGDDPAFQRDMLVTVRSSIDRLRGMLVQLGTGAASARQSLRPLRLAEVLPPLIARWRYNCPQLAYQVEAGADEAEVIASEEKLTTILDHLIQNALDEVGDDGLVAVRLVATEAWGQIEIVDDGPGMSAEFVRDQLFRPLQTSKHQGSGLGAFQALKAVREMGGYLDVDSRLGEGTTMRIKLRRNQAEAASEMMGNYVDHVA